MSTEQFITVRDITLDGLEKRRDDLLENNYTQVGEIRKYYKYSKFEYLEVGS